MRDGGSAPANSWARVSIFVLLFLMLLHPANSNPAEFAWTVSSSVSYDEGKFGTDSKTKTLVLPVSLRLAWGEIGDLEGSIAYIHQTSAVATTIVGGVPVPISGARASRTTDGVGDTNVRARYFALKEGDFYPGISPVVSVKFPTADNDKGLGTGEFDFEGGIELNKSFGPVVFFASGSYTRIGDPPGQSLRDRKGYAAGVSWNIMENFGVTGSIGGSNALVKGQDDPLAVTLGLSYSLTPSFSVNVSGTKGLTDGSPDFSVSIGLSFTSTLPTK